jgi:hypothetical protein
VSTLGENGRAVAQAIRLDRVLLQDARVVDLLVEKAEKYDALNTPEIVDFLAGVEREALHQRERWAAIGDGGKSDADWFWLLGYLGGKALHSGTQAAAARVVGDPEHYGPHEEKRLHHIITVAAACLNWHAARVGAYTAMRPGIAEPKAGAEL